MELYIKAGVHVGYSAVADMLIKHGADIMAQDIDGPPPAFGRR